MLSVSFLQLRMCRTLFRSQTVMSCLPFKDHTRIVQVVHSPINVRSQSTTANEELKEKVYIGEMTLQVKSIKLFSLVTSVSGLIAQPFLIEQAREVGSAALVVTAYGLVGFFTFVTPVLLHLVTRRYVTEIVYDSKTGSYTASTISLFLRRHTTTFTPNEVIIPDTPRVFTTFTVNGKPFLVEPPAFKDISHYGKIMGYDKPLDLKLGNINSPDSKK